MDNGVFSINRSIFLSDINKKPPEWFKIWIYLISNVQYDQYKGLDRGQGYFTYEGISREILVKYNSIAKFMSWAEKSGMLARQKSVRGVVVTLHNYDDYQDHGKIKARQKQDRSKIEARLLKEEDKEDKEDKDNVFFEWMWKTFPHQRTGSKKEASDNYKKSDLTDIEFKYEIDLLNLEIDLGVNEFAIKSLQAMQRWIKNKPPTSDSVKKIKARDIVSVLMGIEGSKRKEYADKITDMFGKEIISKALAEYNNSKKITFNFKK